MKGKDIEESIILKLIVSPFVGVYGFFVIRGGCALFSVSLISWEQRKVGELTNVLSASRVHKEEWAEDGVPFFRSSDVVSAFKGTDNEKAFISFDLYEQLAKSSGKLEQNDILITGGGSIGIPYIVPDNKPLYSKDADLIWIKHSDKFDSRYLYTYFTSEGFRRYLSSISHTGTIAHYTIEQVKDTPVELSSIDEQKTLGEFFDNLNSLITLHQSKLFEHNKKKTCQFMISWEQRKLGDLGTTFTGLSGKSKEDFGHGDAQFVTYMNVFTNPVSDTTMTEHVEIDNHQSKVQYGDVFFTTSSETPDEVGMSSVWLGNTDNIYLNSFCFGYRPEVNFDPYYMAYMLRSDVVRKNIIFLAQGISRYNISKNRVMDIEVPVPSLAEQKKIGSYFKNLDHLITLHQSKLSYYRNRSIWYGSF